MKENKNNNYPPFDTKWIDEINAIENVEKVVNANQEQYEIIRFTNSIEDDICEKIMFKITGKSWKAQIVEINSKRGVLVYSRKFDEKIIAILN